MNILRLSLITAGALISRLALANNTTVTNSNDNSNPQPSMNTEVAEKVTALAIFAVAGVAAALLITFGIIRAKRYLFTTETSQSIILHTDGTASLVKKTIEVDQELGCGNSADPTQRDEFTTKSGKAHGFNRGMKASNSCLAAVYIS